MNKYDEAINSMNNLNMVLSITESERKSVKLAIEALEKQSPKLSITTTIFEGEQATKLKEKNLPNYETFKCPKCNHIVKKRISLTKRQVYNYCPNCGQAIDWSENNG